jgi:hypothetical protein
VPDPEPDAPLRRASWRDITACEPRPAAVKFVSEVTVCTLLLVAACPYLTSGPRLTGPTAGAAAEPLLAADVPDWLLLACDAIS